MCLGGMVLVLPWFVWGVGGGWYRVCFGFVKGGFRAGLVWGVRDWFWGCFREL